MWFFTRSLISIRINTFRNAEPRRNTDYIEYPEHKHIMLPAKDFYNVSRTVDPDLCQKAFNKQRDFAFGIFSAGLNYLY